MIFFLLRAGPWHACLMSVGGKAAAGWNGFKSFVGSGKEKVEKKSKRNGVRARSKEI